MKKAELISKIIEYVLAAIAVILVILGFQETAADAMKDGSANDMAIIYTIVLLFVGVFLALVSTVIDAASDPKSLVKGIISVVVVAIVLGILWSLSDDTPLNLIGYEGNQNQGNWLKVSDTSIFCCYIGLGGAVLTIIVTEIYELFR